MTNFSRHARDPGFPEGQQHHRRDRHGGESQHWTSGRRPTSPSSAYAGALDFRHRFLKNNYEISGSFDQSRVQGSPQTMLSLQQSGVHNYQRPDADLPLDPNRTVLTGDAEELRFGKIGGEHIDVRDRPISAARPASRSMTWASCGAPTSSRGARGAASSIGPRRLFLQQVPVEQQLVAVLDHRRAAARERRTTPTCTSTSRTTWGWHFGGTLGQLGETLRRSRMRAAGRRFGRIRTSRRGCSSTATIGNRSCLTSLPNYFRGDEGRSSSISVGPRARAQVVRADSARRSDSTGTTTRADNQFYGRFTDAAGTHYTFAHLDQRTTSVTARLNYTFTPDKSLQTYVQPFVSKGTYSNVRQLSPTPRADAYDDRYAPYLDPAVTSDPGGFNFKQLQSNVVYRWEYKPGSTLFVVWNHGRQGFAQCSRR